MPDRRLAARLAVVAVLLAGCASTPPTTAPVTGLTAEANVPRLVDDPRTVAVWVSNDGPAPVWVREIELVSESFAPTGPVAKGVAIQPGTAKALTVVPGEARCGGRPAPPLAPATARLVVAAGETEPADADHWQAVELPVAQADRRWTSRLHADCAAQLVTAAIEVRLADWSDRPDGRLAGALIVQRRTGDQPIVVHELLGSVVYALTADRTGGDLGELPPGEGRLVVPVTADAAQCGGHVLADAKYPYGFRIVVSIGAAARLPAAVATDPAGQDRLRQLWRVRCG